MTIELFISYLIASTIVAAMPGPNVLLVTNDSIAYGFKNSLLTMLGVISGMAVLFSLSLVGIATFLIMFSWFFGAVKWAGVCYLIYLGVSQIIASFKPGDTFDEKKSLKKNFFAKGFLISVTNPKGLIFAGAFFPQFLNKDAAIIPQILLLCGGFLFVGFIVLMLYALCGNIAGRLFKTQSFKTIMNRISGAFLIFFGIGLAFMDDGNAV